MPDWNALSPLLGPAGALVTWLILQNLPYLRDRIWPDLMRERQRREEREQKAREVEERRKDRALDLQEQYIAVLRGLELNLAALAQQIRESAQAGQHRDEQIVAVLKNLGEDMAGIYELLGQRRPRRRSPGAGG